MAINGEKTFRFLFPSIISTLKSWIEALNDYNSECESYYLLRSYSTAVQIKRPKKTKTKNRLYRPLLLRCEPEENVSQVDYLHLLLSESSVQCCYQILLSFFVCVCVCERTTRILTNRVAFLDLKHIAFT